MRKLKAVGGTTSVYLPRLARIELKLFVGDWVELELDTDARTLILRAATPRTEFPLIKRPFDDMVPLVPEDPPAPRRRVRESEQPDLAKVPA